MADLKFSTSVSHVLRLLQIETVNELIEEVVDNRSARLLEARNLGFISYVEIVQKIFDICDNKRFENMQSDVAEQWKKRYRLLEAKNEELTEENMLYNRMLCTVERVVSKRREIKNESR